jgi:hypothetical protein
MGLDEMTFPPASCQSQSSPWNKSLRISEPKPVATHKNDINMIPTP